MPAAVTTRRALRLFGYARSRTSLRRSGTTENPTFHLLQWLGPNLQTEPPSRADTGRVPVQSRITPRAPPGKCRKSTNLHLSAGAVLAGGGLRCDPLLSDRSRDCGPRQSGRLQCVSSRCLETKVPRQTTVHQSAPKCTETHQAHQFRCGRVWETINGGWARAPTTDRIRPST